MKNITFTNVDSKSMLILKLALLNKKSQYFTRAYKAPNHSDQGWLENADICEQFLEQLRAQE